MKAAKSISVHSNQQDDEFSDILETDRNWCVSSLGDNIISIFQIRTKKVLLTFELPVDEEIDNIIRVKTSFKKRDVYCLYRYEEDFILAYFETRKRNLKTITLNECQRKYAEKTKNLKGLKKRNLLSKR